MWRKSLTSDLIHAMLFFVDKVLDLRDLVKDLVELALAGSTEITYEELRRLVSKCPCLCRECRALAERTAGGEQRWA